MPKSWRFASATNALPAPDEHVDRRLAEQAVGHRGERLHAAQDEHPVDAREVRGVDDRVVGGTVRLRGRARDHRRHAGLLRDADGHERARGQGKAAGGKVRADPADGDVAGAGDETRDQLDLEVDELCPLRPGEGAGALGAELDRLAQVGGQPAAAGRDGRGIQFEVGPLLAVELQRVVADGVDAAPIDVEEHRRDGLDDGGIPLRCGSVDAGGLEVLVGAGEGLEESLAVTHARTVENRLILGTSRALPMHIHRVTLCV